MAVLVDSAWFDALIAFGWPVLLLIAGALFYLIVGTLFGGPITLLSRGRIDLDDARDWVMQAVIVLFVLYFAGVIYWGVLSSHVLSEFKIREWKTSISPQHPAMARDASDPRYVSVVTRVTARSDRVFWLLNLRGHITVSFIEAGPAPEADTYDPVSNPDGACIAWDPPASPLRWNAPTAVFQSPNKVKLTVNRPGAFAGQIQFQQPVTNTSKTAGSYWFFYWCSHATPTLLGVAR